MIAPGELFGYLEKQGISFVAGVPDSLLSSFSAYITEHVPRARHVIAANEGGAVALAVGHHLATGQYPLVYMQNSGLGNAVNPLLSLADAEVYSIPMLLMIGWRGEPGMHDEPQHVKQGRTTLQMLEVMEIPYVVVDATSDWQLLMEQLLETMKLEHRPVALVVKKGTFLPYKVSDANSEGGHLTREEAISLVVEQLKPSDVVVATTGMTSRELYEIREKRAEGHARDFLVVGSMGHCSQIALGIASSRRERTVICLDGDGSAIMHMGNLAIIGHVAPENLIHIILDNGAHDSVGGQPTASSNIDFVALAQSVGYRRARLAATRVEVVNSLGQARAEVGPSLLWIKVRKGARADLGRPKTSPIENKHALMEQLLTNLGQ